MARKLHIGGEKAHPEWEIFNIQAGEHVDHVGDAGDLSRFDENTFDEIYASHVLEHFDYQYGLVKTLKEWRRVLKPDGKLYISVPDLEILSKLFLAKDQLEFKDRLLVMRMMFGGHMNRYDYHFTGFDSDILGLYLGSAGFTQMTRVKELGIFKDASTVRVKDTPISLNVIVTK
ncbi:MAG: methyltransferase type 11 [Planctomycetes bacterium GWF2_41_51]|nr:MAG: methyltransferase type 11 [Planctomycetes bacterium GWF2_41_51]